MEDFILMKEDSRYGQIYAIYYSRHLGSGMERADLSSGHWEYPAFPLKIKLTQSVKENIQGIAGVPEGTKVTQERDGASHILCTNPIGLLNGNRDTLPCSQPFSLEAGKVIIFEYDGRMVIITNGRNIK